MNNLVIGSTGAIGGAIATALEARGDRVVRLSRRSQPPIDVEDERTIAAAAAALADQAPFDRLIIATGLLHDAALQPEKRIAATTGDALDRYFRVNATGPALVIRHFLALIATDRPATIAALSARVGSIGDNRLGGWTGYRASKAALNQIIRTFSIELARSHPRLTLVGLHPGTVDSRLSAPFQRSVPAGQLFDAAGSAERLLTVIDVLTPDDGGGCFDWAGQRIAP